MPRQHAPSAKIYQLKIALRHIRPPVWRRILVSDDLTLNDLHYIIQIAMGWMNSHLHQFIIDNEYYSDPEFDLDELGDDIKDETRVLLSALRLKPNKKFLYEYDFGDDWFHEITVEKVLSPDAGTEYPVCIKGKRACPPEDCGGPWGYMNFLRVINDPDDPEHQETVDWIGGKFDPESFSVESVNRRLTL